ncbi:MAG: DHHA1 domain-containing protein [Nanoarchaeota archaeon]
MLTSKQMEEVREHLNKAGNPVFYFDNDADGLCSFLLLSRFIGRGKGVAVRSYPNLDKGYARKAQELGADYVFVLDKPVLSEEFVGAIAEMNLPMVWIDHHDVDNKDYSKIHENFFVYNPAKNNGKDKSSEPVTYLSYKISERKEDMWIAVMGCIADHYMPDFADDFGKKNSELWGKVKEPFDAYFGTEIGKIAQALNFGLKDSITNVVKMQNFLLKCNSPSEVLEEVKENTLFRKKYSELKKKYDSLLEEAEEKLDGKILFFDYGGESSMSAQLSNELSYRHKNAYVVVAYRNGGVVNISIRGKNVKKILSNILNGFEGASGGGHEDAVGARVKTEDLKRFEETFREEIGKK